MISDNLLYLVTQFLKFIFSWNPQNLLKLQQFKHTPINTYDTPGGLQN